jgi:hypothetical protein
VFLSASTCCSSPGPYRHKLGRRIPNTPPPTTTTFHLPEHLHQFLSTPCTWVTLLLCRTLSLLSYIPPRLRNCRNHEQVPGLGKSSGGMLRHTYTVLNAPRPAMALLRQCFRDIGDYVLTLSAAGCSSSSCKSCSMRAAAKSVYRMH